MYFFRMASEARGRGGPAREHGRWNTMMLPLPGKEAQVPSQVVLHNGNGNVGASVLARAGAITNYVGTAELGCPAEQSSALAASDERLSSCARLDSRGRLSPRGLGKECSCGGVQGAAARAGRSRLHRKPIIISPWPPRSPPAARSSTATASPAPTKQFVPTFGELL